GALPLGQHAAPATAPLPPQANGAADRLPEGFVYWADPAVATASAPPPLALAPAPPRGGDPLFPETLAPVRAGHHLPEPLAQPAPVIPGQVAPARVQALR